VLYPRGKRPLPRREIHSCHQKEQPCATQEKGKECSPSTGREEESATLFRKEEGSSSLGDGKE